jgi:colanic acid/amylovoran biosynthesis glycosyltransferase
MVSPYLSTDSTASATNSGDDFPGVLIYTPHLLSTVQHYVREHAMRLRRYRPVFAGRRLIQGTPISGFPKFTFEGPVARFRELRFLVSGTDATLSAFVKRNRVKLIHAHFGTGGVEIMPLAARLGIPLIAPCRMMAGFVRSS